MPIQCYQIPRWLGSFRWLYDSKPLLRLIFCHNVSITTLRVVVLNAILQQVGWIGGALIIRCSPWTQSKIKSRMRSSSAQCFHIFFANVEFRYGESQELTINSKMSRRKVQSTIWTSFQTWLKRSTFLAPDLSAEWDFCPLRLEKAQTWALDFNRYLCLGAWEVCWSGSSDVLARFFGSQNQLSLSPPSPGNFPEMSPQKAAICLYLLIDM